MLPWFFIFRPGLNLTFFQTVGCPLRTLQRKVSNLQNRVHGHPKISCSWEPLGPDSNHMGGAMLRLHIGAAMTPYRFPGDMRKTLMQQIQFHQKNRSSDRWPPFQFGLSGRKLMGGGKSDHLGVQPSLNHTSCPEDKWAGRK